MGRLCGRTDARRERRDEGPELSALQKPRGRSAVADSRSPPPSSAASRRRARARAQGRGLVRAGRERPAPVGSVHVTAERRALRALLKASGAHASAPAPLHPAPRPSRSPGARPGFGFWFKGR